MHKFISTILALFYLVVSTGATVHAHYCMDKLVEVGLVTSASTKTCSNCGMEKGFSKKAGCCSNQQKLIQLDIDQKTIDASFQLQKVLSQAVPVFNNIVSIVNHSSQTEESPNSNSPPQQDCIAIYKRNCVFRI